MTSFDNIKRRPSAWICTCGVRIPMDIPLHAHFKEDTSKHWSEIDIESKPGKEIILRSDQLKAGKAVF